MFNPIEFIEEKRDGKAHSKEDIWHLVMGVMNGTVADYQLSAWLMAAYLNGLNDDETGYLTRALANSGDTIKYPDDLHIIDKHSTGGVGDKTTVILIPLVAACGVKISKLSGPGLGFTGGTVDKLESIPGMSVHLTEKAFKEQVNTIGCAVSGHSKQLAPAEGKFYKMRDVTGTVASIPLISSSIISKKLAGGGNGFIFDVKCGSGAFMRNIDDAAKLAKNLVSVSKKLGKDTVAIITDMEQPLGEWVGNAAEVYESICVLRKEGPADTRELCITLGANMLLMAGVCKDLPTSLARCAQALDDGSALAKFQEMVTAQGGAENLTAAPYDVLPAAKHIYEICADADGYVSCLDARLIGEALRALGGGRIKQDDKIDPAVAIQMCAKIGDMVHKNEVVLRVHYNTEEQLKNAAAYLADCITVSDRAEKRKLVIDYFY